jgi:hypothetical protein
MKALRFSLINLPGRIIRHGRRLIIRVAGEIVHRAPRTAARSRTGAP